MTSANTTARSPVRAAARVFAIPELLEHILIVLAHEMIKTSCGGYSHLGPTATLSRYQAVNHTFHSTVTGSPKLQRLMYMGRTDAKVFPPLYWFFKHHLQLQCVSLIELPKESAPRYTVEVHLHDWKSPQSDNQFTRLHQFERTMGHEEATWRRVKLRRRAAKIILASVELGGNTNGVEELEPGNGGIGARFELSMGSRCTLLYSSTMYLCKCSGTALTKPLLSNHFLENNPSAYL